MRLLAPVTIVTVLGTVCVLYAVFIACQVPYFFSAFSGSRPEGWLSYSEYARQGFFELCRLAAMNLAMLLAANIFSRKLRAESKVLKVFNSILALITLLLLATAFSKMALYIDAFGLTILRILPCVFMALLAVVCVSVLVLQKVQFSIVRVALVTGAVLFAALCLVNADGLIVRYNTDRYLHGTLTVYDTDILYRSGSAGVLPALEVYEMTADAALKSDIKAYLSGEKERIESYKGTFCDTLEKRAGVGEAQTGGFGSWINAKKQAIDNSCYFTYSCIRVGVVMELKFRKCSMDDLAILQALSRQTYDVTFRHMNTPENMTAYLDDAFGTDRLRGELANEDSDFYFLYAGGALAGYLKLNERAAQTDLGDPASLELERIYVTREFQGKGLGGALMGKALATARQRGKTFVWLGVWEKNEKAIGFYIKNGFYEIGRHSFVMGDETQSRPYDAQGPRLK